jgi:hypothetical protein
MELNQRRPWATDIYFRAFISLQTICRCNFSVELSGALRKYHGSFSLLTVLRC